MLMLNLKDDHNDLYELVLDLLITVVVVSVITPKRSEETKANGIREEDLSASIHPHLERSNKIIVCVCL